MIAIKNRLNNFLETYEFYPNSVDFRIVSSRALEKFKNVQAFQLNEIRNGKYQFGRSRRELLLLKFDLLTRVLTETENLCIQYYHEDNNASDFIIDATCNMLSKSRVYYNRIVLEEHAEAFDLVFTSIWVEIVRTVEFVIRKRLEALRGVPLEVFFSEFVNIVATSIQNSTFELFELDVQLRKHGHVYNEECNDVPVHLAKNESIKPTKCIDSPKAGTFIDEDCPHDGKCLMLVMSNSTNNDKDYSYMHLKNKIEIYLSYFDIEHVFFKNLSDYPMKKEVIELVESFGIPIDHKRSLIA